ncbi:AGE family epimerase/isomerase [Luteolibacter pohnpeiensis]|uniref:AGE family epimerase/isomerase n=1 Tax=Luteolibacter pohnpeiensis TaxID=454153 RepID=A0A934S3B9_9BACT|nr:glycoside hydrolase family 76 protein [Luteolibacter pohnpeiensis]MBK1881552.1 AGE family epimerase/isomerase [Luteolibacter pohnpeiensis]
MIPNSDISRRRALKTLGTGFVLLNFSGGTAFAQKTKAEEYQKRAFEVMEYIQKHFWDSKQDLYKEKSTEDGLAFLWPAGVMFSALVGACRYDKRFSSIMRKYFEGLEGYWDGNAKVPGYEPVKTSGGNDKYYDDNAWMVITYLEAYELTKDSRYIKKAAETLKFVISGWDEELGGGIWWHVAHKGGGKNTCVNAPAAVGCLRLAKFSQADDKGVLVEEAAKIVEWTDKTLRASNGLYKDSIVVETKKINDAQLTYNSALMLRAKLGLYSQTKNRDYLKDARKIGEAAESLANGDGIYRDPWKWSHLMVEADLELYRWTKRNYLLKRAKTNVDQNYESWTEKKPEDLITNASLARELWLMADAGSEIGEQFWREADKPS